MNIPLKICIVGQGKVSRFFTKSLANKYEIIHINSRQESFSKIHADLFFIATSDCAIEEIFIKSYLNLNDDCGFVHFSGLKTSDIFSLKSRHGVSLHPACSINDNTIDLSNIICTVEGTSSVITKLTEIINYLKGEIRPINGANKPLYHAICTMASNHQGVLAYRLAEILKEQIGFDEDDSAKLIKTLFNSSLDNLIKLGLPSGLTGPRIRGDLSTVALHIKALSLSDKRLLDIYQKLDLLIQDKLS